MLQAGQSAPNICLPDDEMHEVCLASFKGKQNVVLYFYPKDDTPGCTTEAVDFSSLDDYFKTLKTAVIGISRDDCISHAAFRDKHGLTVQLLSDTEGEACEAYGVWQEKEKEGKKYMGIVRSTFIIDKTGTIQHALYGVKADKHAKEVLELVRHLK